ncbi:MAG: hypothetical protein IJO72_07065 [Oscillospiraceae bacterium]|nr:hypothetical protein [Oscillospiraceae bacterium]MBQ9930517.1 hypothetical protein [Oscillospiraceae bacterium]
MKRLRSIVAILLCLSLFFTVTPAIAAATELKESPAEKQAEATAELKEFAAETVLPFIKGWLKSSGAIGRDFETTEEIDALQLGAVFPIYSFKSETSFAKTQSLSEAIYMTDRWMMLACTPEGEAKWYARIGYRDGGYYFVDEGCAVGLGQALGVFNTINSEKKLDVDPTVIYYRPYEMIVMEVIDSEEYVITAGETLDSSYLNVTDYQYLPCGMDAIKELRLIEDRNISNEKKDLENIALGDPGLFWLTASEQPQPKLALETWHILLIGGACLAAIAAAGLVIVRKRKEKQ